MTKIDFYILPASEYNGHLKFACRLIEKIYKQNHRVYIHAANTKEAHDLDELLWTYREDSFLPHHLYGEGPEPAPPIQIGFNQIPNQHRDVLINLNPAVPDFYKQFQRVLELVVRTPEAEAYGRERYRHYRKEQHEINTHKLDTLEA